MWIEGCDSNLSLEISSSLCEQTVIRKKSWTTARFGIFAAYLIGSHYLRLNSVIPRGWNLVSFLVTVYSESLLVIDAIIRNFATIFSNIISNNDWKKLYFSRQCGRGKPALACVSLSSCQFCVPCQV